MMVSKNSSTNVTMNAANFDKALRSIKSFLKKEKHPEDIIFNAANVLKAETFEQALEYACFSFTKDNEGNINSLRYEADKLPLDEDAPIGFVASFARHMRNRSRFALEIEHTIQGIEVWNGKVTVYEEILNTYNIKAEWLPSAIESQNDLINLNRIKTTWGGTVIAKIEMVYSYGEEEDFSFALYTEQFRPIQPEGLIYSFSPSLVKHNQPTELTITLPAKGDIYNEKWKDSSMIWLYIWGISKQSGELAPYKNNTCLCILITD